MKCTDVRNLLSQYIENDLDEETKKAVAGHIALCAACAKELDEVRGVLTLLKSTPEVEPPADFLASVHRRLEQTSFLKEILRRVFIPVHIKVPVEALGLTLGVVIVVILTQRTIEVKKAEPRLQEPVKGVEFIKGQPRQLGSQIAEVDFQQQFAQPMRKAAEPLGAHREEKLEALPLSPSAPLLAESETKEMPVAMDASDFASSTGERHRTEASLIVLKSATERVSSKDFSLPEEASLQLILKGNDLNLDFNTIVAILQEAGATGIKSERLPEKIVVDIQITPLQLEAFLSRLKETQISVLSMQKKIAQEKEKPSPFAVKIILTL